MRNTIATSILTAIDAGANAKLVFRLTGSVGSPGAAVATLTCSDPSGTVTAETLTFTAITSDTNAAGNASPVAAATLQTSADTVVLHCAVTTAGPDIAMSGGLTIGAGDTVSCSALSYTAPV